MWTAKPYLLKNVCLNFKLHFVYLFFEHNCMPKAIVGDEAFFQEDFLTYYRTHGIKKCPCGSRTHGLTELKRLSDFSNDNGKS